MGWLAWAYYPNDAWFPVVMWTGFVLSIASGLYLRKKSWTDAGLVALVTAFVFFSVVFTVVNGVQSTGALGSMFLLAYLSIVTLPPVAIVRVVMSIFRKHPRRAE